MDRNIFLFVKLTSVIAIFILSSVNFKPNVFFFKVSHHVEHHSECVIVGKLEGATRAFLFILARKLIVREKVFFLNL